MTAAQIALELMGHNTAAEIGPRLDLNRYDQSRCGVLYLDKPPRSLL